MDHGYTDGITVMPKNTKLLVSTLLLLQRLWVILGFLIINTKGYSTLNHATSYTEPIRTNMPRKCIKQACVTNNLRMRSEPIAILRQTSKRDAL
jgi:hypothetical protein